MPALQRLKLRYAIIGGVAVILRGYSRSTTDIDLVVLDVDSVLADVIDTLKGDGFTFRVQNPLEFARKTRMILAEKGSGIHVDLSMGLLPFEEQVVERASLEEYADDSFAMIAQAQDLIIMKLIAFRERDREDVRRLKELHPEIDWDTVRQHVKEFSELIEDEQPIAFLDRMLSS